MDPQMAYMMERWNQMQNQQAGIRPDRRPEPMANMPQLSQYRQLVNQTILGNPQFGYINPDMIMRLMQRESNWNPAAVGAPDERGEQARGLMQVKPSTGADMMRKKRVSSNENLFFPEPGSSVRTGIDYLDWLKRRYGGTWSETLQRYHLGAKAYREGKRDKDYADYILGRSTD